MNPMIRKELRQRMRERRGWILPSLYLLALCAIISFVYYESSTDGRGSRQGWQFGVELFLTLAYAQLALLLLMAPIFSAGALTIEKEQRTLPGLLTSLLGPLHILVGEICCVVNVHSSAVGNRDSGAQRGLRFWRRGPLGSGYRGIHHCRDPGNG